MRVIWISLGLMAVFLVALFAFHEPQQSKALLTADNPPVVDNPFVEEKTAGGIADKQVDLAVLPTGQDDASAKTPVTDNNVALTTVPEPATATSPSQSATPSPATVESSGVSSAASTQKDDSQAGSSIVNEPIEASQQGGNEVVTDNPVPVQPEEKKLGLAMIAFEKEKQKNKVAVIVHETNSQKLTEKEIKALYLDRLTRWEDGSRVMLYDLPLGDKYRDKFSQSILKMTALEADKQETKRRELRIKANDVEVKAKNVIVSYVEQHPNAVAYVPLNLVREKAGVKIVLTIP